jgi:hypothetical protein
MMSSSSLFRSLLVMGPIVACANGINAHAINVDPETEHPRGKVMEGLEVAKEHTDNMFKAAKSKVQEINVEMMEAVQRGVMMDAAATSKKLNDAITKMNKAKEVQGLVTDHVKHADEFFDLVGTIGKNKKQMEVVRSELKSQHELKKAASAQSIKEAKESMAAAATQLVAEQTAQETSDLEALEGLWGEIKGSEAEIKVENDKLTDAPVSPAVETATTSVETWANGEMAHVCEKKGAGDLKLFTKGSACSRAGKQL